MTEIAQVAENVQLHYNLFQKELQTCSDPYGSLWILVTRGGKGWPQAVPGFLTLARFTLQSSTL